MSRGLSVVVLVAVGLAYAHAAADPQYLVEFRSASQHQLGCFGGKEDAACAAMVAAYDRAMSAPDANDAVRHEMAKPRLHAVAVWGGNRRAAGDPEGALQVLEAGYVAMLEHFDNGKHAHALIDNLRLQQETALTLATLDRMQEVEWVLSRARTFADRTYELRDRAAGKESAMKVVHQAISDSEKLETSVGDYFRDRAKGPDAGGDAARWRELSLTAYGRAEQWLRRKIEAGFRGIMDQRGDLRLAQLQLEQAILFLDNGDRPAATRNFLSAAAACVYLDPAKVAELGLVPLESYDVSSAQTICNRATAGWGVASEEGQKLIDREIDRFLEEEFELLREAAER